MKTSIIIAMLCITFQTNVYAQSDEAFATMNQAAELEGLTSAIDANTQALSGNQSCKSQDEAVRRLEMEVARLRELKEPKAHHGPWEKYK